MYVLISLVMITDISSENIQTKILEKVRRNKTFVVVLRLLVIFYHTYT
jgi:hypothetical protein